MSEPRKRRTRSGGRAGAKDRCGTSVIEQMPWNPPVNIERPTEPLGPKGVLAIHDGAMRILEEIGIAFLNLKACVRHFEKSRRGCDRSKRPYGP